MTDDKDVTDPLADPGHLFDQTNGIAEGLEGDSDGTAASETASEAERADEDDTPTTENTALLADGGPRIGVDQ